MTYKEFLEGPIKQQNKDIGLNCGGAGYAYHAFALDAISIEFLGKLARCNNSADIGKSGNEKNDFVYIIENYFPSKYKPFSEFLYTNLRCGMTHFFGPKSLISLATKSVTPRNLEIQQDGRLLLVFDEFHNDLCGAIDKLISENKSLLDEVFLDIS